MREIVNINAKWAFTKQADAVPETLPMNWNWVNLPHSWNAIDGQDGGNDYYRGTCYYARVLNQMDLPGGFTVGRVPFRPVPVSAHMDSYMFAYGIFCGIIQRSIAILTGV